MSFIQTIFKILTKYGNFYAEGVRNTLIISLLAVCIGTILGALMALARMSRFRPLRWLATAYIEFFRGTPLMVQLTFIFYGLPMIGVSFPEVAFIPDFSRFMAGVIAMSLNSCAYVAEVIRSGIQAVDPGQMEAARCLGLSGAQGMTMVVLPQAIRNILPALGNEFVTVIKESSVVSVIGIADLMYRTNGVKAKTYNVLECLAVAAIIYFIMTFFFSKVIAWTERRMAHGRKL
ncbi:MAG: amino acid ABC transporter permease [Clostridia bacterium]|nr:amino acid ABC transporter permease [Clostridia bacterium]